MARHARRRTGRCAFAAVLAALAGSAAPAAGVWSTPFDVVQMHELVPEKLSGNGFHPRVAVASSAAVSVFAWTNPEGDAHRVQARVRTLATGAFGPVLDVTDAHVLWGLTGLAVGSGGHARMRAATSQV